MNLRGSLGESLLHILIICNTLVHTAIAKLLLKVFPRCAIDMIEGEEYLGATGLHLAIGKVRLQNHPLGGAPKH